MQSEDILVVGAGPAGLAVSACLRKQGLQHTVVEREDTVGSAWRGHYDRLHLHTTKTFSGMPMTPWPKTAPRYPSRDAVVQYLQAYADEHQVKPRLGICVHSVDRQTERFVVRTYKNSVPFRGKRTLAVGCGNSGAEIALDLAENGVEVAMVVRGPVHVVPRDMFG
jgi:cation diffusion facilitator CzcD-associated flavoprotein CzcO